MRLITYYYIPMKLERLGELYVVRRGAGAYLFPSLAGALRFIDRQREARVASFMVRTLAAA